MLMKIPHSISPSSASGFTLVEVIVALGIFVFAVTVLMGVMPFGMKQVQTTSNENLAMTTMEAIRDDLALASTAKMTKSLRYGLTPPTAGTTTPVNFKIKDNGEVSTAGESTVCRIIGTLRSPPAAAPGPLQLHLRATWPSNAPAGREAGAVELVSAFQP